MSSGMATWVATALLLAARACYAERPPHSNDALTPTNDDDDARMSKERGTHSRLTVTHKAKFALMPTTAVALEAASTEVARIKQSDSNDTIVDKLRNHADVIFEEGDYVLEDAANKLLFAPMDFKERIVTGENATIKYFSAGKTLFGSKQVDVGLNHLRIDGTISLKGPGLLLGKGCNLTVGGNSVLDGALRITQGHVQLFDSATLTMTTDKCPVFFIYVQPGSQLSMHNAATIRVSACPFSSGSINLPFGQGKIVMKDQTRIIGGPGAGIAIKSQGSLDLEMTGNSTISKFRKGVCIDVLRHVQGATSVRIFGEGTFADMRTRAVQGNQKENMSVEISGINFVESHRAIEWKSKGGELVVSNVSFSKISTAAITAVGVKSMQIHSSHFEMCKTGIQAFAPNLSGEFVKLMFRSIQNTALDFDGVASARIRDITVEDSGQGVVAFGPIGEIEIIGSKFRRVQGVSVQVMNGNVAVHSTAIRNSGVGMTLGTANWQISHSAVNGCRIAIDDQKGDPKASRDVTGSVLTGNIEGFSCEDFITGDVFDRPITFTDTLLYGNTQSDDGFWGSHCTGAVQKDGPSWVTVLPAHRSQVAVDIVAGLAACGSILIPAMQDEPRSLADVRGPTVLLALIVIATWVGIAVFLFSMWRLTQLYPDQENLETIFYDHLQIAIGFGLLAVLGALVAKLARSRYALLANLAAESLDDMAREKLLSSFQTLRETLATIKEIQKRMFISHLRMTQSTAPEEAEAHLKSTREHRMGMRKQAKQEAQPIEEHALKENVDVLMTEAPERSAPLFGIKTAGSSPKQGQHLIPKQKLDEKGGVQPVKLDEMPWEDATRVIIKQLIVVAAWLSLDVAKEIKVLVTIINDADLISDILKKYPGLAIGSLPLDGPFTTRLLHDDTATMCGPRCNFLMGPIKSMDSAFRKVANDLDKMRQNKMAALLLGDIVRLTLTFADPYHLFIVYQIIHHVYKVVRAKNKHEKEPKGSPSVLMNVEFGEEPSKMIIEIQLYIDKFLMLKGMQHMTYEITRLPEDGPVDDMMMPFH